MSIAVIMTCTARRYAGISNVPAGVRNFIRLKLARLHAELSRNMYSEHGFDALIRAVFLLVCQRLMVVSYCIPGSPHCHVASAMWCMMSRALYSFTGAPFFTALVQNVSLFTTAFIITSAARTELFAFWKKIDVNASLSGPEPS